MLFPTLHLPSKSVIEDADAYLNAALLIEQSLSSDTAMMRPACLLAALAIEIYLKSFDARYSYESRKDRKRREKKTTLPAPGPAPAGEPLLDAGIAAGEGHNLYDLFFAIEEQMRDDISATSLALDPDQNLESELTKYADFFVLGRYGYEVGSEAILRTDLFRLAEHMSAICHELMPKAHQYM